MKHALTALLAIALASPALADPPSHAPAHGYRDKNKQERKQGKYRGYTGVEWEQDYGVAEGHCNTDAALTAAGALSGAVIANRTASPENRAIATIVGAIIGGVVGNKIGDAIDDTDRACMGHSLEVAPTGRSVSWTNPRTRVAYTLRPVRDLPDGCRLFEYRTGANPGIVSMTACRAANATWSIRPR